MLDERFYLLISTCQHYIDSHIPGLVNGLRENKFPLDQVIVVNSQASSNTEYEKYGVQIRNVTWSMLHLTGCQYVASNASLFLPNTSFLALPCSIRPLSGFTRAILSHAEDFMASNAEAAPLLNPYPRRVGGMGTQTMDMGFFKLSHLQNLLPYLEKRCVVDGGDREKLLQLKLRMVCDENKIFGLPSWFGSNSRNQKNACARKYCCHLSSDEYKTKNSFRKLAFVLNSLAQIKHRMEHPYKITHFRTLGFEKFQRNFQGPSRRMILGDEN